MELKNPHPPRLLGGMETWKWLLPHPRVVNKNPKGYLGSEDSQTHTNSRSLPRVFQCQEDKSP